MVGLTASELQVETLFPGDTIEYYSMAFVAGDPRGHRLSKVLRVDRKDDEFPISVDTQEILPLTIMLKRKRDRNDVEISSEERRRPKKKNGMLEKFVERIEEIEVKKQDADINEYLALDAKQQNEIKTVNSRMQAGDSDIRGSDRSDKAKSNWKQQRKDFSKANAKQSTTLSSWLTPLEGRRKDELEETSGGTPQKSRRRYLNLSPEKTNSPKMNRKNGISFVMPSSSSGDASHRTKEVGSSKDHALKREGLPLKKRGSLGTAPKKQSLTSRWIGKKSHA
uniref:Uncharacterized protein n=1 Tax=Phytophthora ramorum TaxID=164328 RepID=H3GSA7_PHYRM